MRVSSAADLQLFSIIEYKNLPTPSSRATCPVFAGSQEFASGNEARNGFAAGEDDQRGLRGASTGPAARRVSLRPVRFRRHAFPSPRRLATGHDSDDGRGPSGDREGGNARGTGG